MCVCYIYRRYQKTLTYYITTTITRILWLFLHTRHILSFSFFFVSTPVFPFSFQTGTLKNRLFVVLKTLLSYPSRANIFPSTVKTDFWFVVDMRGWLTGGAVEKEEVWSSSDGFLCLFIASLSTFFHMVGSACLNCNALHGAQKVSSLFSLSPFPRLRLFAIEMWNGCLWVAKRTSTNRLSL